MKKLLQASASMVEISISIVYTMNENLASFIILGVYLGLVALLAASLYFGKNYFTDDGSW